MKGKLKMLHRSMGILLAAAVVLNTLPVSGFAVSAAEDTESGFCEHHSEHTAECGYAETQACDYVCEICDDTESENAGDTVSDSAKETDIELTEETESTEPEETESTEPEESESTEPEETESTESEESESTELQAVLGDANEPALASDSDGLAAVSNLYVMGNEVVNGSVKSGNGWSFENNRLTLENLNIQPSDYPEDITFFLERKGDSSDKRQFEIYLKGNNTINSSAAKPKLIEMTGTIAKITGDTGATLTINGCLQSGLDISGNIEVTINTENALYFDYGISIDQGAKVVVNSNNPNINYSVYVASQGETSIKNGSTLEINTLNTTVDTAGYFSMYGYGPLTVENSTLTINNNHPNGRAIRIINPWEESTEKDSVAITDSTVNLNATRGISGYSVEVSNSTVTTSETMGLAFVGEYGETTITDTPLNGLTVSHFLDETPAEYTACGEANLPSSLTIKEGDTMTVPEGASLNIHSGATLTNNGTLHIHDKTSLTGAGTLTGNGSFLIVDVTEDMISIPEGLAYTGTDLADQIKLADTVTICGAEFTADTNGWSRRISPSEQVIDAGEYTVTFIKGDMSVSKNFTVAECSHTELVYAPLEDNRHGGTCPTCGTEVSEEHKYADGACSVCNAKAVVRVKIGSDTTYYGTIDDAWTAACAADSATVTLLANATAGTVLYIESGDNITFDGGNYTLFGYPREFVFIVEGGKLTITGGTVKAVANDYGANASSVSVHTGELVITGGTLEGAGTNGIGLLVLDGTVRLSGGKFIGGTTTDGGGVYVHSDSLSLSDLLLNYGTTTEPHYAYFDTAGKPIHLDSVESTTAGVEYLSGTITVAECRHDASVCEYQHNDGTKTHTLTCLACGYTGTEDCTYSFHGNVGTCSDCKDTLTVSVSGTENLIYDGTAKKPEVTVTQAGTALTGGYTVTCSDNINAGTASVTVTIGDNQGTYIETFTIGKATPTVVWSGNTQTLTYTGNQAEITPPNVTLVNGERFDGIIRYSYQKDGETTYKDGLPTDAGTYTIKARINADGSYTAADSTNELTLTIDKADAEITAGTDTYNKTFGDAAFTLDVTDDNQETDVQYEVTEGTDVVSVSNDNGTVTIQNTGTAVITVSLPETANYNAAENKTITVNVAKKGGYTVDTLNRSYCYLPGGGIESIDLAALLPADCGNVTYGKPEISGNVAYSAEPVVNSGKLSYTIKSGSIGDKGTITVAVTTRNYEDITITVNVELTGRLTVSLKEGEEVTLKNDTLTYGETLSELAFNEAAFVDSSTNTIEGSLAWKDAEEMPNAGTASAVWVFTPSDDQYEKLEGNIAIIVKKAVPEITAPAAADRVYNPSLSLADSDLSGGSVKGVDGKTLKGTWNWKYANVVPTVDNSGYEAVFTPEDTDNYETAEAMIKLTVQKAEDAPNMPDSTIEVSGDSIEKVSDIALPEGWEWQDADKDTVLEAGTVNAVAVYTGADKGNYENETVTVTITVTVTKPACDHVAGEEILYTGTGEKAPTCTEDGFGHRECTKCGSVVEPGIVVPAPGHDYISEVTKEPTVLSDGEITYTCSRCGGTYTETIPKETPEGLWVSGLEQSTAYTGSEVKPEGIRVYHGGTLLREKAEYTLSYKNNTRAGTAQVIVTGKGSYQGKATAEFTIEAIDLSTDVNISAGIAAAAETGRNLRPTVTVTWNGRKLKEKTDYTLTYDADIKTASAEGYDVTISGKGNYTGAIVRKFRVAPNGTPLLNNAKVTGPAKSYPYQEGKEIPEGLEADLEKLSVKIGKTPLTKGTDYTVRVENGNTVGTGTIVIEAAQTGAYAGEKRIPVSITGTDLKKCHITGLEKTYPYTGGPVMPEIKVYTGRNAAGTQVPSDAYTVRYSNCINQGKATITVTGAASKGYSGSVKATYTIGRCSLATEESAGNITVTMPVDIKYAKGGAKPQPIITHTDSGALREGVDYTLKYSGNTSAGGKTRPAVIITGIGNYCGTITKNFDIGEQDIGTLVITAADKAYDSRKKGSYYYSDPQVYDLDGNPLKSGKDYTVRYTNASTGQEIGKTDMIENGTEIRVTVTAAEKSGYTGTLSTTYHVRSAEDVKDIAKAKCDKIAPQQYTGSEIRPEVSLYTLTGKTKNYLTTEDYEIIGCYNNVKKGTATILIRGTNAYSGVKSITFKITAADNQSIWSGVKETRTWETP